MKISTLHLVFRIACAMCFIGHGSFGFITKQIWCNYFAVFGIGEPLAYELMPVVGAMDVALGLLLLLYPIRFAAMWLVFWGIFTATLRPLAGEPFAELIERAGNFGAPWLLLLLSVPPTGKYGLSDKLVPAGELDDEQLIKVKKTLQIFGFLLLLGHGLLNLAYKTGLLDQYAALGFSQPKSLALYIGMFECLAAFVILIRPFKHFVLVVLAWKVISEIPYPAYATLEWIERGGSYGVLLGLWMILNKSYHLSSTIRIFSTGTTPRP